MKLITCFRPFGLLPDPIECHRKRKEAIKEQIKTCQKKMDHAKNIFLLTREHAIKLRKDYMKVDRRLAMMDGRYKVVKPYKGEEVKKPESSKTAMQKATKAIDSMTAQQKLELLKMLTPKENHSNP